MARLTTLSVSYMLLLVLFLPTFLTSCDPTVNTPMADPIYCDNYQIPQVEAFTSAPPSTFDTHIARSSHIILGTITGVSCFDEENGQNEYFVRVDQNVKGKSSKQISVIAYGRFLPQVQYVFFVHEIEEGLYPKPIYNLMENNLAIHYEEDVKNERLNRLLASIQASPAIHETREALKLPTIPKKLSNDDLITKSDIIAHVEIESIISRNKYMSYASTRVVDVYKGEFWDGAAKADILLPPDVEAGEQYLAYLQVSEFYAVTAKLGSMVPRQDEAKWNSSLNRLRENGY